MSVEKQPGNESAAGFPRAQSIVSLIVILLLLPVVSIPLLLFWVVEDRASKKARDIRNITYLVVASTFMIAAGFLAMFLYLQVFPPGLGLLGPVPSVFMKSLSSNMMPYMLVLGFTFLHALFMNRLAVNILNHEEQRFRKKRLTFWHKVTYFFKWKNESTTLASGNETLMKIKNSSLVMGVLAIILMATFPLFLEESNFDGVMHVLFVTSDWGSLEILEIAISAAYVVIFGVPFVLSIMLLWFYTGRAFSYQANHYLRKGKAKWIWLRLCGYIVSLHAFIPLALTLFVPRPFIGFITSTCISFLAVACWVVIIIQFRKDPDNLVLDPKNLEIKIREGVLDPVADGFKDPRKKIDLPKKICYGVFLPAVIGISVINAIFWFQATALYAPAVEWYEWSFYLTLGLLLTVGPCLLLLFLRSVYARRLLMVYLLIVLALLAQEMMVLFPFYLDFTQFLLGMFTGGRVGYTEYIDRLGTGERPGQVALVWLVVVLSFVSLYILKRKAVPVAITTRKHGRLSSWKNLRRFVLARNRKRLTVSNVVMLSFLIMVSGTLVTMEPPVTVTLRRPHDHDMRVSFWASGFGLENSTLEILSEHDIRLFGWFNPYDMPGAQRYALFGVEVIPYIPFPNPLKDQDRFSLEAVLAYADARMDFWDANGLKDAPFTGFAFDQEDWNHVYTFNAAAYQQSIEWTRELNEHINSRGYELFLTEYLTSINDLLDGDHDVSINTFNPFDPTWNVSHFDWMIYRTEVAILYNEPSVMFTYEWARHIRRFMLEIGGEEFFAKSSMSIGVTSDELPLYRDPGGLDEFLLDVKVCHAMEISNVIIFYLNFFMDKWGDEGLVRMMEMLDTYTSVSFPFRRRATFFGNLKREDNPLGSAFGFMYQDFWLDEWVGITPVAWLIGLAIVVTLSSLGFLGKKRRQASKVIDAETKPAYKDDALDKVLIGARVALVACIVASIAMAAVVFSDFTVFQWF